ncbi:Cation efflux system protein CusA [Nymphon striatum]|nr:Cation efflux system protein CusA [Nymphon striatum]
MFLVLALGAFGYTKLGQSEDPPFTFKVMLVQAMWPGATAKEIEEQVVNRIEKVILESPHVETVRSFSQPGAANITVIAKDSTASSDMPEMFYQVRKRVEDIAHTLPQGVQGPLFNDEFGDTFGNIFALTGDGFSMAQLRDTSDDIRKELLLIPDVAKVLIIGEQQEQVFVEISNQKLANLGFTLQALSTALTEQNQMVATVGDSTIRLSEVATVRRGYAEPQEDAFRYMGEPALGIGVSMKKGGDIIKLGKILDEAFVRIESKVTHWYGIASRE